MANVLVAHGDSEGATDGQQDRLSQPALTLLWGKVTTSKRGLI